MEFPGIPKPRREYYEWTGKYLITNYRTSRESIAAGAVGPMGEMSLRAGRAVIVDTALGISKVVVLGTLGNVEGLAAEGIRLVYKTLWKTFEAEIADKIRELDIGYPYKVFIEVNVYEERHGFWRYVLGQWNRTGKRVIEVQCGRGWDELGIGIPAYANRVEACEAMADALWYLPVRPGDPLDRRPR